MFKLKYLELGPFRSFQTPQRIDFPENGMVLIQGENKDTGGSSGSGKSSLLIAIEYVFGSSPYAATALVPWQSPDRAATVKLGIMTDIGLVELTRSKKLEILENGVEFKGSAAQKDEYLQKIIGLSPEVRQALTYRGQKSPGLFLSKTNAEKTDFLIPLLDLVRFEKAQEVGDLKTKALTEKLVQTNAVQAAIESNLIVIDENEVNKNELLLKTHTESLRGLASRIAELEKDLLECTSQNEEEAKAAQQEYYIVNHLEDLKAELNTLQTNAPVFNLDNRELVKVSEGLKECEKRLEKLIQENNTALANYNDFRNELNKTIQTNNTILGSLPGLIQKKERIVAEIEALRANKCPTCLREWMEATELLQNLSKKEIGLELDIKEVGELEGFVTKLKKELSSIPPFETDPKIEKLRAIKENLSNQLAAERQKINSAKSLFDAKFAKQIAEVRQQISTIIVAGESVAKAIREKFRPVMDAFKNDISNKRGEQLSLQGTLSAVKAEGARLQANKDHYDNQQKQLQQKLTEKKVLETELNTETDLDRLIGKEGFLGSIFDEVLQEISDETNQTLAGIANTRHVTLQFQSETETKKGTIRKNIVPVVTVGGYMAPIKSALSGGMLSTLELAVDLAVGHVIARRTGVTPGYLMIDEGLEGLDDVSKEACFELLNVYAKERLILVIDHSVEFKSLFSKTIMVSYESACSTISSMV